ncbi:ATP-binding protein [Prevotella pectinovora]|jgi:predicted AAA+ superfamily ATPase|uniref:ATP-binding protein n=1 Tax=Prevotella pectinovora TaxID=1602169 RepID=UPI0005B6D62A|nr:ATP-binding protein [Prevotella pectinovora]KIP55895.1 ATPase AAA [Prevotella pectinovora]KIP58665.1 ATPase AAA [Prevotella pectinovora]KIP64499.1 ATPase AAA [Prevotella pectinovora]MEE1547961.1 ATP-binding protein [Prevotella pectinovora]
MVIERNKYLQELVSCRHNGLVKIITGMRRCGKSFLLFRLFRRFLEDNGVANDHIVEMAFDDYAFKEFRNPDKFYAYVKGRIIDDQPYYILLDEVQMLDEFEDVLNGLLHIPNADVYVTGSNAKFLSKDIITEFRGRGYQIHVSPLSFAEFMSVYEGDREDGWNEYLLYGGLPPVVLLKTEEEKVKLLDSLLAETYIIDVVNRNKIKNDSELNDLFKILASGIGGLTNPQRLSNTFQSVKNVSISPATIKKYIECLSDAFLLESCNRYDVKGRKYIGTPLKYYFSDLGIRNALLGFRQQEKTHLMENAVYNELCARGYSVDVGNVEVNTVDEKGTKVRRMLEVDFVCNRGYKRCYIQSALSLPDREKMQQESASLLRIDDSFMKYVITGDRIKKYQNDDGIVIMNVLDFLLDEQSV